MSNSGAYEKMRLTMSASGLYDPNGGQEAWRVELQLDHTSLQENSVLWAQFNQDPIQRFILDLKKNRKFLSDALAQVEDDEERLEKRSMLLGSLWNGLFRQITGDQVHQLASGQKTISVLMSNVPRDTIWIATKVAKSTMDNGRYVCWSSSIEPRLGSTNQLRLSSKNTVDLDQTYQETMGID